MSTFGKSVVHHLSRAETKDLFLREEAEDKIWEEEIISILKTTSEWKEVKDALPSQIKKWSEYLDGTCMEKLKYKGSRITPSWVLKMFAQGGYSDVEENVMFSFEGMETTEIVKAALVGLLFDNRFRWV